MSAPSGSVRISRHAVDRWRERVDTSCQRAEAQQALARFIREGRCRPTPRRWMNGVRPAPGLRFIYSAQRPGVCVLARDGTALTVLTRSLCGPERRRAGGSWARAREIRLKTAGHRGRGWPAEEEAA